MRVPPSDSVPDEDKNGPRKQVPYQKFCEKTLITVFCVDVHAVCRPAVVIQEYSRCSDSGMSVHYMNIHKHL